MKRADTQAPVAPNLPKGTESLRVARERPWIGWQGLQHTGTFDCVDDAR